MSLLTPEASSFEIMSFCFIIAPISESHLKQNKWVSRFCPRKTAPVSARSLPFKRSSCAIPKMTQTEGEEVKQMLQSDDSLERIRGINRIDELASTSEKLSSLIPVATGDSNQQVRYAAISRISNLDASDISKQDADTVLSAARYVLLNDKEPSCQSGAADLIAGLKLSDGFDDLVDTFNSTSDWMLKFSIAAGMGEMGDPKAFDFLTSILDKTEGPSDMLLITAAIGALGELGDHRGVEVVERFLNDDDPSVRERAAIAHGMLLREEGNT